VAGAQLTTSTSASSRGPGGLFELLDEEAEVAPDVDRLRRDHEVLVARIVRRS
jgi:hypothetical protein